MVVIRLSRGGAKKRPFYHIVVADRRRARDGRYIERLGYYNPIAQGSEVPLLIEDERLQYWLSKGAQPSERVHKLMKDYTQAVAATENKPTKAKAAKKPKASDASSEEATL